MKKLYNLVKLSEDAYIMFMNVKMPVIDGISTFMSMVKFILAELSVKKVL